MGAEGIVVGRGGAEGRGQWGTEGGLRGNAVTGWRIIGAKDAIEWRERGSIELLHILVEARGWNEGGYVFRLVLGWEA